MFGINGGEFIVLLIIAAVVIGPERLPGYAEQLADLVRTARTMLGNAKTRMDDEFSEEIGDVDWAALDPRKYDPRRIVRDVLLEDEGMGLGALGLTEQARRESGGTQGQSSGTGASSAPIAQQVSPLMQTIPPVTHPAPRTSSATPADGMRGTSEPDASGTESEAGAPFDDEAT